MPRSADRQRFRNEDLVLRVSAAVDRDQWDESRYEAYIDELCRDREYQKEAIRTTLRYLLGGEYGSLRDIARANYEQNPVLKICYGSWAGFERQLQLPDKLSATLDLATATGKSYVLYGVAAVLLAEGAVDRVLVLCPSTTIKAGLTEKFRLLASDTNLQSLLPPGAKIGAPRIINADQTIVESSICVENYHAVLEHVGSSIRDSLAGKGARVAVLNDEAHHVANESAGKAKRWKEFLLNPAFGFRFILGVSGTCYVGDSYFSDVIFRYSLRQAMEEQYVKKVEYIAEMPRTNDPDEKWQLVHNRHEDIRKRLAARGIRPLTIVVTQTIARCEDVADELRHFLVETAGINREDVHAKVLAIYSGALDLPKLRSVDTQASPVEWIVSVSMLNEGWDVKRVYQIVPHEERAFNSKLLIAQVLGRGLRIPDGWHGPHPEVTVFNHDAWAPNIRHLVNEVLERERRLTARVVDDSPYRFDLHHIDYTLESVAMRKPMDGSYTLFAKGYVDLATDSAVEDVSIEFERASSGERYKWQSRIQHRTYTPREIAEAMYRRLEEAQDPDELNPEMRTAYTDAFPVSRLQEIVEASLDRINAAVATESMKQKFLQALGPLRRKVSETVRYTPLVDRHFTVSTSQRPADSVSAADLRRNKAIFYTDQTRARLEDEQVEFFDEITEPGAGWRAALIPNRYDFKTPLNLVIADSENERRFIRELTRPENAKCCHSWIKSTAGRFYEIDYAWKKGAHPKRGKFSPDFFIKMDDLVLVIEIKGDEELNEPTDENRKKNEYALAHFTRINEYLRQRGSRIRYKVTFVTDLSINKFFQSLRDGTIATFRSELDVRLAEADEVP